MGSTTWCCPSLPCPHPSISPTRPRRQGEIAGLILEPVVGNSGFIPPTKEFLEGLREITAKVRRAGSYAGWLIWWCLRAVTCAAVAAQWHGFCGRGCSCAGGCGLPST